MVELVYSWMNSENATVPFVAPDSAARAFKFADDGGKFVGFFARGEGFAGNETAVHEGGEPEVAVSLDEPVELVPREKDVAVWIALEESSVGDANFKAATQTETNEEAE